MRKTTLYKRTRTQKRKRSTRNRGTKKHRYCKHCNHTHKQNGVQKGG